MFTLLNFQIPIPAGFEFLNYAWIIITLNIFAWILVALLVNFVFLRIIRRITRQLPGELEDIVFAILKGPLVILIILLGAVQTIKLIGLTPAAQRIVNLLTITLVVLLITHILGRVIKDILVYYGEKWARKTESRVDDILIPIFNLFGPVILVLTASLIILPLWGLNITSVLVGAGVIGLVLGLALQDTLSNIFSGLSLLVEAPFRTGDLITLPDGRICEVQRVGIRSTQLYSVSEHSTVYVPNTVFSTTTLTNITKPTVDQKYSFDVIAPKSGNVTAFQEELRRIAIAHPATISSNIQQKIDTLQNQTKQLFKEAKSTGVQKQLGNGYLVLAQKNSDSIAKLTLEHQLHLELTNLLEYLRHLIRGIMVRETKGLSETERQELFCNFISPTDALVQKVTGLAKTWSEMMDPWLDHSDHWNQVKIWQARNDDLIVQWEKVKSSIYHPNDSNEMRLDNICRGFLEWIRNEYKAIPEFWKDPVVLLTEITGETVKLQLNYYVDNIRLEHDERANRVRSEIGFQIQALLQKFNL